MARRWDRMKREGFLRALIRELAEDVTVFRASPTGFTALGKARQQMTTAHEELTGILEAKAAALAAAGDTDVGEQMAEVCHNLRTTLTYDQQVQAFEVLRDALGRPALHVVGD